MADVTDLHRIYVETLAKEHAARGFNPYAAPAPQAGASPPPQPGAGAAPSPQGGLNSSALMAALIPTLTKNMPDDSPLKSLIPLLIPGGTQAAAAAANDPTTRLLVEQVQRTVNDNAARAATAMEEAKRVASDIVELKGFYRELLSAVDEHTRVLKSLRAELPKLVASEVENYFRSEDAADKPAPANGANGHTGNGAGQGA